MTEEYVVSSRRIPIVPGQSKSVAVTAGKPTVSWVSRFLTGLEKYLTLSAEVRDIQAAEAFYKESLETVTEYPLDLATGILKLALPPANRLDLKASSLIIDHTLSQAGPSKESPVLVTDSAVFGGVTASLLAREAWPSIRVVIERFLDIPEEILVDTLRHTIHALKEQEAPKALPSMTQVLRCILRRQYSESSMKVAIRKGLGVQDLLPLLDQLTAWMIADLDEPSLPETKAVSLILWTCRMPTLTLENN
jgi:hypothetical protein